LIHIIVNDSLSGKQYDYCQVIGISIEWKDDAHAINVADIQGIITSYRTINLYLNINEYTETGNIQAENMKKNRLTTLFSSLLVLSVMAGCGKEDSASMNATETDIVSSGNLTDEQIENLVKRSYQYVAMYNVNNKFALKQGGWNSCDADTELKDHTMREIARPNNDTLYISCLLDLRKDPLILEMPAFDSDYVSLMVTGYDHYVNVPMASRLGDFKKSEKMLLYTARTEGYKGEPVEGVDRIFESTGDFTSAVLRIMPHAKDQDRFKRITGQMEQVKVTTLSEFRGGAAKPGDDLEFPAVGERDADIFENNLLEVMQFVFNHTTFDPNDELDNAILAAYKPLGVVPGQPYDPAKAAKIDGAKIRAASERIFAGEMSRTTDKEFAKKELFDKFLTKGNMALELLLFQSVLGPIGLPATEAVYPGVTTDDGKPLNANNDYVIRMVADEMPPTEVFWSMTLYDLNNGFFIPNDHKKYSVGENAGMKLDEKGGIEVYVAAEKPEGVPAENWLPINRKDEDMDIVLRVYVSDLEKMKTWQAPKAERLSK